MILSMILKSFDFQCDFDLEFQITTSKMIWILILNHLYSGDLILILKSSTYDDFAHLCLLPREHKSARIAKISIIKLEGIIKKFPMSVANMSR